MIAATLAALSRPLPPPSSAPVVVRRIAPASAERVRLALMLCTPFRAAASPAVRALHDAAIEAAHALSRLGAYADDAAIARRAARAERIRGRALALPAADRTPVLVAAVRELLADAPDCCAALDRAVRDAARHHRHRVTAEHEAAALVVLAEECPT